MSYTSEDVKTSQEIFAHLLEFRELHESDESRLYRAYTENEAVQSLVAAQGEAVRCNIARYSDVIYLIPGDDNRFIGYSKADLKHALCRSDAKDRDYYLAQFAILVLLVEFYDGQGSTSKTRDYIRFGELQNRISDHLKEGRELMDEETQAEEGLAYSDMSESWEALRSDPGRRQKTTKEGFLLGILRFLQAQGLIQFIEQDEMIKTTRKLDHFMDWNLLNRANYAHVSAVLGGHPNE
ncbi:MAG: hypothetical protein IJT77_11040 [Clostridia bacterium]|nr:hypothetical protein [Clostridia bacterium]